ncbi:RHO1 GDP-GTP exchange protein 2 [Tieghemiomyces parasiticus]|uniref:RHO1 GDP-GTP exchange protein 2 n=1 Tax=Tieghemiomyces parasiticus TaxID=78921 RepID=A0A9W7ZUJ0_9FUNG|nr:RHO1 GDP-GTP exchange protein 2 [Tieghemiomyces parasiticus]
MGFASGSHGGLARPAPSFMSDRSDTAALSNLQAFQAAVQESERLVDHLSMNSSDDSDRSARPGTMSLYSSISDKTEAEAFWDTAHPFGLATMHSGDSALSLPSTPSLWSQTVTRAVLDTFSAEVIQWQETMYETIAKEQEYLADLKLLDTLFLQPLRICWPTISSHHRADSSTNSSSGNALPEEPHRAPATPLPPPELETFLHDVFHNLPELIAVSEQLLRRLLERQANQPIMSGVGDIFMPWSQAIEPIVAYAANLPRAHYILEVEVARNPGFAAFLRDCEAHPMARKLGLQHFLGRAPTRFVRYPLHFNDLIKRAPATSPDRVLMPQALENVKACLDRVNQQTGEATVNLLMTKLRNQLLLSERERLYLNLDHPQRRVVKVGYLRKRSGNQATVFLLDHVLLICKHIRQGKSQTQTFYQLNKSATPLSLLAVRCGEEAALTGTGSQSPPAALATPTRSPRMSLGTGAAIAESARSHRMSIMGKLALVRDAPAPAVIMNPMAPATLLPASPRLTAQPFPLVCQHLGRHGGQNILFAASADEQRAWLEAIQAQQNASLSALAGRVQINHICDHTFTAENAVHCAAEFRVPDGKRYILVGTDVGLYVGSELSRGGYLKITKMRNVTHLHVFPEYDQLIMISDKIPYVYPLHELARPTLWDRLRGKKLGIKATAFYVGRFHDRPAVAFMTPKSKQSVFTITRPIHLREYNKRTDDKLLWSHKEKGQPEVGLVRLKEFFVPTETFGLTFFRQHLGVGSLATFEIIDIRDLRLHDSLPNPADPTFSDLPAPSILGRPYLMHKVTGTGEFLVCFERLAFYVNRAQTRSRPHLLIHWEGRPRSIQVFEPYIYVFCAEFIEIRQMDTGALEHIIPAINVRCLTLPDANRSNGDPTVHLIGVMQSRAPGYQRIFRLPIVSGDQAAPEQKPSTPDKGNLGT